MRGRDRLSARNQIESCHDARKAWHSLRTAGTRQEPELDFRQTHLGTLQRAAVMTRQRDFESTPQRRAMQGGNDRLCRVFDFIEEIRQEGFCRRLAKLGYVGASDKCAPGANDEHGLRGIGLRRAHGIEKALAYGL